MKEKPQPNTEEYIEPTIEEIKQMIIDGLEDIKNGRVRQITSVKDLFIEESNTSEKKIKAPTTNLC